MTDLDPDVVRNLILILLTVILPFFIGKGTSKKDNKQLEYPETNDYDEYHHPANSPDNSRDIFVRREQIQLERKQASEEKVNLHSSQSFMTKSSKFKMNEKSQSPVQKSSNLKKSITPSHRKKRLKKYSIKHANIKSAIIHKEILEPRYFD